MSTDRRELGQGLNLFVSPDDFFKESVKKAFVERKIETYPHVETYLIKLLQHYLDARNLFDFEKTDEFGQRKPQTMAELYLVATNAEHSKKIELLKKLADKSLYMSGFFGDSFDRKIIDVDYYADMGGAAYRILADCTREDALAKVYSVFSVKFVQFMDVLAYISQNSLIQSNQSVLRLYDRYLRTGSELAREKLVEMGVFTLPFDQAKLTRQS
ncbi:MAG: hypothetical protein AABY64_11685 [Bdellovibrionota bacterium]